MRSPAERTSQTPAKNPSIFRRALDGIKEVGNGIAERIQGISHEIKLAIQLGVPLLALAAPALNAHAEEPQKKPSTRESIFFVAPQSPNGAPVTTITIGYDLLSPGDQCEDCSVQVRCPAKIKKAPIPGNNVTWQRDDNNTLLTIPIPRDRGRLDFRVRCPDSDEEQVIIPAFDPQQELPPPLPLALSRPKKPLVSVPEGNLPSPPQATPPPSPSPAPVAEVPQELPQPAPLPTIVTAADHLSLVFPNGASSPITGGFAGVPHLDCKGCFIKLHCEDARLANSDVARSLMNVNNGPGIEVKITDAIRGQELLFGCKGDDLTIDPPRGKAVKVELRDPDWSTCPGETDLSQACRSQAWQDRQLQRTRADDRANQPSQTPSLWTVELRGSVPFVSSGDVLGIGAGFHLERRLPEVSERLSAAVDVDFNSLEQGISDNNPAYAPQDASAHFGGLAVNPFVGAMLGTTAYDGETVNVEVQGGLEMGSMVVNVGGSADAFKNRETGEHADLPPLFTVEPAARACGEVRAIVADAVTVNLGLCSGGTITPLQKDAGDSTKDQQRLLFANGHAGVGVRF
ncbi:MAG: hypothetical protein AAB588_05395 [Patescibacteria group bacterium]